MSGLLYLLFKCLFGKFVDLRTPTGKLSLFVSGMVVVLQIVILFQLYFDVGKIVKVLFYIAAAFATLVYIFGLLDILRGFCKQSRFITFKSIKNAQTAVCVLFAVLNVPGWYHFFFLEENAAMDIFIYNVPYF
jgi:hypothetical protein